MVALIIGGSGSGKSEYAEGLCMRLGSEKKIYIATMEPYDGESYARIRRHRKMRDGKGFTTVECYTHLEDVSISPGSTALLECVSNLTANEMFSQGGRKSRTAEAVMAGISMLCREAEHAVIVTNQVFSDGVVYDGDTQRYLRALARINRQTAALADVVCEIVHGIPVRLKGEGTYEAYL